MREREGDRQRQRETERERERERERHRERQRERDRDRERNRSTILASKPYKIRAITTPFHPCSLPRPLVSTTVRRHTPELDLRQNKRITAAAGTPGNAPLVSTQQPFLWKYRYIDSLFWFSQLTEQYWTF